MNKGKSMMKRKENQSIYEKEQEDEDIKKYEAIINKLSHELSNTEKIINRTSNARTASSGKNKSNMRQTISKTKEDRNDKDFLITFMNEDSPNFLPKNLHLLYDNDSNKGITNSEKFKNLAKLMLDDKEQYTENLFVRKGEERFYLKLYTALSKQSKDVFLNENNEKQKKNRILLQKLNEIHFPSINFQKFAPKSRIMNNDIRTISGDINDINNNFEINENEIEDCYFKQKQKGIFYIPDLVIGEEKKQENENKDIKTIKGSLRKLRSNMQIRYDEKQKEKEKEDQKKRYEEEKKKYWDPELDSDLLSYINHNIINIEELDIEKKIPLNFNFKKNNFNEENDNDDEEIIPIIGQEILSQNNDNNNNNLKNSIKNEKNIIESKKKIIHIVDEMKKSVTSDDKNMEENHIINHKFNEYNEICSEPKILNFDKDKKKMKETDYNYELKDRIYDKLNEIWEFEGNAFPANGTNLSSKKIYKYAKNNENNEEISTDSFTIEGTKLLILKQSLFSHAKSRENTCRQSVPINLSLGGKDIILMNVKPENKSVEHSAKSLNDYFSGKGSNFNSRTATKKLDFNDDTKLKLNDTNPLNNSIISNSNINDKKSDSDSEYSSESKKEVSNKINDTKKSDEKMDSKEDDDSSIDNKLQKAKRERQLSFSSGD